MADADLKKRLSKDLMAKLNYIIESTKYVIMNQIKLWPDFAIIEIINFQQLLNDF